VLWGQRELEFKCEQNDVCLSSLTFLFNPSHSTGLMLGLIGEKENSLKTDDYGRDLSSVQTLLTKQVSVASLVVDCI
jgi:spectrin alpha